MSQPPPSTDDLFASLGGSLMKDLWADLQADDTQEDEAMMGWSLEQLEKELAHLEDDGPNETITAPPGLSAASLVVSHAQERMAQQDVTSTLPQSSNTISAADAWSQSLQNFASLEKDFLAADSARKSTTTARPGIDDELLRNVQEYNVQEVATLPPGYTPPQRPPGMPSPAQKKKVTSDIISQEALLPATPSLLVPDALLRQQVEVPVKLPPPHKVPLTPQNSLASIPPRVPPTPQNSSASLEQHAAAAALVAVPVTIPAAAPIVVVPQQPIVVASTPTPKQQERPAAWSTPQPQAAVAATTTPQPIMRPVYCQPDPAAPPIPSAALESNYMKARDVAFVLHAMLKPILAAGVSPNDYDVMLWQRRSGQLKSGKRSTTKKLEKEMQSRTKRSKEWTQEHSTLGHSRKSDVSRPRALIAVQTSSPTPDENAPNKERATLWKARLYVDQGYQAYHKVVDVWRRATPGTVPPQIQPHLVKLLKCLGIKLTTPPSGYTVDESALELLLKLPKGQTLLARILEQALLPPNAVQALLPVALGISIHSPLVNDVCNIRLFRAFSRVITTLPNMEPSCLVESIKAVEDPDALKSTARMECIHALLKRGGTMAEQDASFAPEWSRTEQDFMKLLG